MRNFSTYTLFMLVRRAHETGTFSSYEISIEEIPVNGKMYNLYRWNMHNWLPVIGISHINRLQNVQRFLSTECALLARSLLMYCVVASAYVAHNSRLKTTANRQHRVFIVCLLSSPQTQWNTLKYSLLNATIHRHQQLWMGKQVHDLWKLALLLFRLCSK